ncbi:MAG: hypothetical protein A3H57_04455 [Candidatus Taylorbacteria bacterium RIFCSPLOWO2_02_FULL_43_11]|uniref:Recombination protein RecR n=1 Tax=Candidatus Taylorbacteria bacterium RIFCSPHIGHO2_02_FULL_43_32b TaxID=1802306 RepID=A0A1G2MF04_9BACT|nr:MAG: hypothetical protein A2743_02190 [Candidatus Taylorbacteria bacterium RIFCSPHIGHO2_01_FULL_43_47]OHA22447.1 MAG: hypothetical protein A3C72_03405 [Candidatus Taylorbacteria bacterium RIFCSPHIGHO2_02_FULL_43_32b]OHA31635.1 MAG: hypothetical protein A3B08_04110 [Candidatus Taylorbacteria bacterium RIFCSPLOWO2_01_FULL_43_44]OHA36216.1 MAG: hypothetical protein A3H57_04455 [Candidatus Taylorbacteria bacterium RIFCSPLOWO2_02_FULL_43_11]
MDSIHKIIELFRKFPGIGPRQAKRFAYFLLSRDDSYNKTLARLILDLKSEIKRCGECQRFMPNNGASACSICTDKNRDGSVLSLVTNDVDMESFERSGVYNGKYFVFGGNVPILDNQTDSNHRVQKLFDYIKKNKSILKEIILALNATPEGEHTFEYLLSALSQFSKSSDIKISRLGRGLSTGTELEYADPDTLKNALKHRE